MKTILLSTLVIFSISVFGQIPNQNNLDSLLNKATLADSKMYFIYDLNVFSYYELTEYESDLQKQVYKKTADYAGKIQVLKELKAKMLKTTYYIFQEELFNEVNYDMNKKGFTITLGSNSGMGTLAARAPKSIPLESLGFQNYSIYLKALPSKQIADNFFGEGSVDEKLFIPVNESIGLKIEENRANIVIYYFFTPSGKEQVTYKYICMRNGLYNMKEILIKSDKVRIIVANKETQEILYDKTNTYQPPTKTVPTSNKK